MSEIRSVKPALASAPGFVGKAREIIGDVKNADAAVSTLRRYVLEQATNSETRADGALRFSDKEFGQMERLSVELFRALPKDQRAAFVEKASALLLSSKDWLPPLGEVDANAVHTIGRKMWSWPFFVEGSDFATTENAETAAAVFDDFIRFSAGNSRTETVPQQELKLTNAGEKEGIQELAYYLSERLSDEERPKFLKETGQKVLASVLSRSDIFDPKNEGDRQFLQFLGERMQGFDPAPEPVEDPPPGGFRIKLMGKI